MTSVEEGWHKLPDGVELYTKTWRPTSETKAVLIYVHGFSDHCNRYADFFPNLASSGITVHSFDQRGWGRSVKKPSDKGLTGPTSQVLGDIASIIESHLPSSMPIFLMGHSMGGQETLQFAANGPPEVRKSVTGFLASGPWIALHPNSQPNKITLMAGKLAAKLLPKRQMVTKLESKYMSHDEAMCKDWEADELCHNTGTLEGIAGMFERAEELHTGKVIWAEGDDVRVFIGHGTGDMVTSCEASEKFVERQKIKDKTLNLYEGCYHCLHLEPADKARYTADVAGWILARAKPQADSMVTSQPQSKL